MTKRTGQKQWPKTPPKAFYLGRQDEKQRCIENLTQIATLLDLTGPSDLLRWLGGQEPSTVADALRLIISVRSDAENR